MDYVPLVAEMSSGGAHTESIPLPGRSRDDQLLSGDILSTTVLCVTVLREFQKQYQLFNGSPGNGTIENYLNRTVRGNPLSDNFLRDSRTGIPGGVLYTDLR
jgi:hypothetical protein